MKLDITEDFRKIYDDEDNLVFKNRFSWGNDKIRKKSNKIRKI